MWKQTRFHLWKTLEHQNTIVSYDVSYRDFNREVSPFLIKSEDQRHPRSEVLEKVNCFHRLKANVISSATSSKRPIAEAHLNFGSNAGSAAIWSTSFSTRSQPTLNLSLWNLGSFGGQGLANTCTSVDPLGISMKNAEKRLMTIWWCSQATLVRRVFAFVISKRERPWRYKFFFLDL